ncbi:MAG: transcription factor [Alyxoria varia]|nr:MAG: transcription factor [Alyxoria varia]
MPPSGSRRGRTRKVPADAPPPERSEGEDADEVETVTPNRKRRRLEEPDSVVTPPAQQATNASRLQGQSARRSNRANDIKVYEDDSPDEEDPNVIIRHLRTSHHKVAARVDYANEVHERSHPNGRKAYAKIAAKNWTYYVDELEVRIGRPPEERVPGNGQGQGEASTIPDWSLIHIDLGPNRNVSRQHARICYDEPSGEWYISVNGRNGARVDDLVLQREGSAILRSGCVIEIAGTQMMFIMPNEAPEIHPIISAQVQATRDDEEDDEDEDHFDIKNQQTLPHRTPPQGRAKRATQTQPSSSNDQSSGQQQSHGGNVKWDASAKAPQNDGSSDVRLPSSQAGPKASPSYSRGLMLESTEDIDYKSDAAKDLKPPHSYAQLIGMAIMESSEQKLTLANIYEYIRERYAFYRFSGSGWQNSIRHNLSLNKSFEKVARRTDEPGKGMKWQIVPEFRDDFIKKGLNQLRKGPTRGSSAPNSPMKDALPSTDSVAPPDNAYSQGYRDAQADLSKAKSSSWMKPSPDSTPPMTTYPLTKQAFTPERGGRSVNNLQGPDVSSPLKGFTAGISPLASSVHESRKFNGLTEAAVAGSPGGPRISLGNDNSDNLVTPLFSRQAPKLAPPSTARLPSQFMPMSSPAPFWKYTAESGSTPAGPKTAGFGSSPVKGVPGKDDEEGGLKEVNGERRASGVKVGGIRSSSPPVPEGELGQGSPTRVVSSRGGEKVQSLNALHQGREQNVQPPIAGANGNSGRTTVSPPRQAQGQAEEGEAEDEDDEGEGEGMIDLAR